jgi:uncharacterized protein YndB with AHSA1/START domain
MMTEISDERFEMSIEHHIDASPETVWTVMTERTTEWWCPKPWQTEFEKLEWQAGGTMKGRMHGPNPGEESPMEGIIVDFVPGRRFAFTDAFKAGWIPHKPFMIGLFEIEPEGTGTRYTATARHWDEAAMKQHAEMGFTEGWTAVPVQLAQLCEKA